MWDELKRPTTAIAVVLLIISIASGVLISEHYYKEAKRYANITYEFQQIQIFDRNNAGILPLTLRDKSGNIIKRNIYAAIISVWNSGNSGIEIDNIREPFRIAIKEHSAKIIELVPVFYTRNNVDRFDINPKTGEINWKYFDAGEGFKVRLIYANASMAHIKIAGYAVDTPIIDYNKLQSERINVDNRFYKFEFINIAILIFLITLMEVGSISIIPKESRVEILKYMKEKLGFTRKGALSFFVGGILAIVIYYYFIGIPVKLPKKPF